MGNTRKSWASAKAIKRSTCSTSWSTRSNSFRWRGWLSRMGDCCGSPFWLKPTQWHWLLSWLYTCFYELKGIGASKSWESLRSCTRSAVATRNCVRTTSIFRWTGPGLSWEMCVESAKLTKCPEFPLFALLVLLTLLFLGRKIQRHWDKSCVGLHGTGTAFRHQTVR